MTLEQAAVIARQADYDHAEYAEFCNWLWDDAPDELRETILTCGELTFFYDWLPPNERSE